MSQADIMAHGVLLHFCTQKCTVHKRQVCELVGAEDMIEVGYGFCEDLKWVSTFAQVGEAAFGDKPEPAQVRQLLHRFAKDNVLKPVDLPGLEQLFALTKVPSTILIALSHAVLTVR